MVAAFIGLLMRFSLSPDHNFFSAGLNWFFSLSIWHPIASVSYTGYLVQLQIAYDVVPLLNNVHVVSVLLLPPTRSSSPHPRLGSLLIYSTSHDFSRSPTHSSMLIQGYVWYAKAFFLVLAFDLVAGYIFSITIERPFMKLRDLPELVWDKLRGVYHHAY